MTERIKLKLINQNKWSLIVNNEGELWIAKDDSIFNPSDRDWSYEELVEAESFIEFIEKQSIYPTWISIQTQILEMIEQINYVIDQRHKWDLIDAEED